MQSTKPVKDLEERTFTFARDVRTFVRGLPKGMISLADGSQLVRSSGSVGANYIEAQEALSKKDFGMRIKICRKEAKESQYWLRLIEKSPDIRSKEHDRLTDEAFQLVKIFSAILLKL